MTNSDITKFNCKDATQVRLATSLSFAFFALEFASDNAALDYLKPGGEFTLGPFVLVGPLLGPDQHDLESML